jgi:ATP-dependent RNA helicase DeaD
VPLTTTTQPNPLSLRESLEETIGPELAGALEKKGFERLTPVQEAVLAADLQGRDLRISSQTGSGKTVAIGLVLRDHVRDVGAEAAENGEGDAGEAEPSGNVKGRDQRARPRALVVTPTRELAKQVEEELTWLYAPLGARVTSVTGGGGYRDELRAFRAKPAIVVGTPGRLLDHLKRGAIDASATGTVVLDEADRMLDLGFREDLEAILGYPPEEHRTHLVSATFPREVRALADRVQKDAVPVEGTPLGTANLDIEHLIHLVHPRERLAAIINLLLENPGGQTLVFARTRADVAEISQALADAGFNIAMLSGEMEQAERNRALAAFKRGNVDALVATDVAARGIDVQDVTRVLHAEPPTDADAYTHRSGRTGRAGKKGISSVLVAERELARTTSLLARARVRWRFAPLPTAEALRDARDEDLFTRLAADFVEGDAIDPRSLALAERVIGSSEPLRAVGRLVALALRRSHAEPRDVTLINPPSQGARAAGAARRREHGAHESGTAGNGRSGDRRQSTDWVAFRVSWGEAHGADPRRLVAMMCRRGKIEGRDIGAIRIGRTSSVVEVADNVAADFERATAKPDPRDPRVHVRRWSDEPVRRDAAKDRPSVPKDRESTTRVPKDRASAPKARESTTGIPRDRVSKPREASPSKDETPPIPKERPSRAAKAPPPRKEKPRKPWHNVQTSSKKPAGQPSRAPWNHESGGASSPKRPDAPPWRKGGRTAGGHAPPKRRGPPR